MLQQFCSFYNFFISEHQLYLDQLRLDRFLIVDLFVEYFSYFSEVELDDLFRDLNKHGILMLIIQNWVLIVMTWRLLKIIFLEIYHL